MQRAWAAFAVVFAVVISGCTGPGSDASNGKSSGGEIVVDEHGESYLLGNNTGGIVGRIRDDIGVPVGTAHIALLGTSHSTFSNRSGSFQLLNVTPGRHTLRVEHMDYRSAEETIEIIAGKVAHVSVLLVPKVEAGAGYRPHLHDYWGGETEITLIDRSFEWHEPYDDSGPYAESFGRYYDTTTLILVHPCVWTAAKDEVYFNQRQVWFNDPNQLVFAGTSRIEIVMTWTQQDYPLDELAFAWRSADTTKYEQSPMIKKGATFTINVQPHMWDSSHQTWTLWDFWMCTGGETGDEPKPMLGSVHLVMKIIRGHEILPEQPHPYFWQNGTESVVIPATAKNFSAGYYATSRSQFSENRFTVRPPEGVLVPPGTSHLTALLEFKYATASPTNKPFSLTYRPANVYPFTSKDPGTLAKPSPESKTDSSRLYVIPLKPGENDAFYQKKSNWVFFLNFEGEEADWKFVNPCPCAIQVTLTVTAHKDPSFDNGPTG